MHEQQLSWLATQPARLLFAQIDRASGTSYQDFLLQAKSILDSHSTKYIDHISNYIADSRLVKTELFKNIEATDANLYLYDAPYNKDSSAKLRMNWQNWKTVLPLEPEQDLAEA